MNEDLIKNGISLEQREQCTQALNDYIYSISKPVGESLFETEDNSLKTSVLYDYDNCMMTTINKRILQAQENRKQCKKDFIQMYRDGIECESEEQQKEIINKFINKWGNSQDLVDLSHSVML